MIRTTIPWIASHLLVSGKRSQIGRHRSRSLSFEST